MGGGERSYQFLMPCLLHTFRGSIRGMGGEKKRLSNWILTLSLPCTFKRPYKRHLISFILERERELCMLIKLASYACQ